MGILGDIQKVLAKTGPINLKTLQARLQQEGHFKVPLGSLRVYCDSLIKSGQISTKRRKPKLKSIQEIMRTKRGKKLYQKLSDNFTRMVEMSPESVRQAMLHQMCPLGSEKHIEHMVWIAFNINAL